MTVLGNKNMGSWNETVHMGVWQDQTIEFSRRLIGKVENEPKLQGALSNEPKLLSDGDITNQRRFSGDIEFIE